MTRGTKWPLGPLSDQFTAVVGNLDTTLSPFYKEADAALQRVAQAQSWTQARLEEARQELGQVQAQVTQIRSLAPDSQQVELVATSAAQVVEYIKNKYQDPQLAAAAKMATDSLDSINDLVASFKENPGRRLISIYLGSFLGWRSRRWWAWMCSKLRSRLRRGERRRRRHSSFRMWVWP